MYVHSSDEMYGADRILLQMVTRLKDHNFIPIVIIPTDVPYEKTLSRKLQAEGIEVIYFKTAVLRRMYFTPIGLIKYATRFLMTLLFLIRVIRQYQIDLVHSNTLSILPGAFAAKIMRIPHVWHVHEIIVSPKKLHQFTSWLAVRMSNLVVAVSTPTQEHLIAGTTLQSDHVIVLNNGIELDRFDQANGKGADIRREWGVSDDEILIGMIGRISRWKGQDHFIKACKIVSQDVPSAKFCLVGDAPHGQEILVDNIKKTIQRENLESKCIISGFRNDIPAVLDAFDIFVLPSTLPDPFPTTVLEAMASSKPIVAYAHGGSLEMVANNLTGYLVPPDKLQTMAETIIRLANNMVKSKKMGENGRTRLEKLFSVEAFIQNWSKVYQDLLET